MSHIFISYARKNKSIALAVKEKLEMAGKYAWVDLEDIHPSSDWKKEIKDAILSADAFIYLLSQESIKSSNCREEFETAQKLNKRFFLILLPGTFIEDLEEDIAKIHVLDWENVDTKKGFNKLIIDIDTDHEWRDFHTDLLEKAKLWQGKNDDSSRLLRGKVLDDAEIQLAQSQNKNPEPMNLQREFLLASRKQETRNRNSILTISVIVIVVLVFLSGFAFNQRNSAISNAATAQANANMAISRQLTILSQTIDRDTELNMLLNIKSFELFRTVENEDYLQNPQLGYVAIEEFTIKMQGKISSVTFSQNGEFVAASSNTGSLVIVELPTRKIILDTKMGISVFSISFSPNNKYFLAGGCLETDEINSLMRKCLKGSTRVYEVQTGKLLVDSVQNGLVQHLAISNDGRYFASGGCDQVIQNLDGCGLGIIRVLEIATGKEVAKVEYNGWVLFISFSSDGEYLYSAGRGGLVKVLQIETGNVELYKTQYDDQISLSPDGGVIASMGCGICKESIIEILDTYDGSKTELRIQGSIPNFIVFNTDLRTVNSNAVEFHRASNYFLTVDEVWYTWVEKDNLDNESRNFLKYKDLSGEMPVAFSPAGNLYISGGEIFDLNSGNELFYFPSKSLGSIAISYDENYAVTGSDEGEVVV